MESSVHWDPRVCMICFDEVRPAADGSNLLFQACDHCSFPVCRPCYEFERKEGSHCCPNCHQRYLRRPGTPWVEGDGDAGEAPNAGSEFRNVAYGMAGYGDAQAGGSLDDMAHLHPHHTDGSSGGDHSSGSDGYPAVPGGQSQGEIETMSFGSEFRNPLAGPHHNRGLSMSSLPGSGSFPGSDPAQMRDEEALPAQVGSGTPAYVNPDGIAWKARVEAWKARQDLAVMLAAQNRAAMNQPPDGAPGNPPGGGADPPDDARRMADARKPLSRIVDFPAAQITQYRVVIVARLLVIMFFFHYRLTSPVSDAYALWLVSVICEVWFAFSWILDQFPKWMPLGRETFLDRLSARYERDGDSSKLAAVDLFVSTVDPIKEPILTTANTILSILAMDYPVDKFSCYVSDDGAAMLTFEGMAETAEFAKDWVPFCKKFEIEPRAPEVYFSQDIDFLKNKVHRELVIERREMKEKYNMFKIRFNALVEKAQNAPEEGWTMPDGTPWPGNNRNDHPGMIQVFLEPARTCDREDNPLPRLVYVSREKRPGFNHHKKAGAMNSLIRVSAVLTNAPFLLNLDCDHYVNNSRALKEAMCFMMDPLMGKRVCYVQFPQRFDGIDRSDRYANHNTVFFDINLRGLDGIQGPVYVGTGCCFNRNALYGYDAPEPRHGGGFCGCCGPRKRRQRRRGLGAPPEQRGDAALPMFHSGEEDYDGEESGSLMAVKYFHKRFGPSELFVASTLQLGTVVPTESRQELLKEAIHTISCGYEDRSEWGKELGWIYGSVTEDILTGFKMHCRGWRSVYCMPPRPAFKGSAPINLSDRLQQVLRWALGSVEIFLSRHCPLWYGWGAGRLKWLERLAYVNTVVYPWTSFPLVAYCTLPAVCLLTNKFIIPTIDTFASIYFLALFVAIFLTAALEMRWSGVAMDEWWRNEQFWVIGGVSSHLFAVFQGLLKVLAGVDTNFTVTAKQVADDEDVFAELYVFKYTSLLLVPTALIIVNLLGAVAGIAYAINTGFDSWGPLFGKLFFAFWVVVHLYPFLKGLTGRNNRTPTVIIVWAILLASIFSLLWVRIDPFVASTTKTGVQQCGLKC